MAQPTLIARLRNGWEQSTGEASVGRLPLPVLLAVVCVALAVWVSAHRGLPWKLWSGDACEYAEMGRRLAAGEGFTTGVIYPAELEFGFTEDHPAVMRPPLWPLALAAVFAVTGPSDGAAHAITGAFFLGTVALTTTLGAAVGGPVAGAIAGLALATTPAFAGLALDAVSETPFAFFITLAFLLTVRRSHAFAIGLTCGLAYLTRYNGLLLFPVLLALLWAHNPRAVRPLLWCGAGLALVVLPWWLRNLWLAGNPLYSLLNLNLYFSPFVTGMHDSLYYVLEPDLESAIAMHPVAKLQRQLPELVASWPLASLNLVACIGVVVACARGHWPSVGFAALAIGTTVAVAFGLPQGRYFVPFMPLLLALGASGWIRYGGGLAAPALALLLLAPLLPSYPEQKSDLRMVRGFFEWERNALRKDPSRYRREEAAFAAMSRCLGDRPLVLAQGAARIVWETGAIAIYASNHPEDFWRIVDEVPVEYAQMERFRKIDQNEFGRRFERRSDCGPGLYQRRPLPTP
jgi:4-amino-4-deoxy-L-arabinose transferase-like glycosyltransferase